MTLDCQIIANHTAIINRAHDSVRALSVRVARNDTCSRPAGIWCVNGIELDKIAGLSTLYMYNYPIVQLCRA